MANMVGINGYMQQVLKLVGGLGTATPYIVLNVTSNSI